MEPAFSQNTVGWPLAGPFVLPPEPDDPDFSIPNGSLQSSLRDAPERNYIVDTSGELTGIPAEPLGVALTRQPGLKWKAAVVFSCILHAAVAMAFLATDDERTLIEGADQSGIMLFSNAPDDQSAAGDITEAPPEATKVTLVTMLDPKPVRTVEAQTVTATETTQPVETTEAEASATATLEPLRETPDQPASEPDRVDPVPDEPVTATATNPLPEILTADLLQPVEDDNSVPKPATQSTTMVEASETIPEKMVPVETLEKAAAETDSRPTPAEKKPEQAIPEKTAPVETLEKVVAETERQPALAEKKPQPAKPRKVEPEKKPVKTAQVDPQKKVAKAPEKPGKQKAKAGSGGQNEADAKRGVAEGQSDGKSAAGSQGGSSGVGNASATNYPGKVRSRLARFFNSARVRGNGVAIIVFTVASNGGVQSARVASSSGVAAIDKAALDAVRRASPYPPIPAGAGRSSWEFRVPLGAR